MTDRSLDNPAHSRALGTPRPASVVAVVMLALGFAAVGNLMWVLLFGSWQSSASAVDELYFQACAIRGLAVGEIPSPGCHDNKAPLIFMVHQLVAAGAGGFDLAAIKIGALVTVAVVAGLAALVAGLAGGVVAGLSAAALVLLALASDMHLLALKTELVGSAFLLGALWLATRRPGHARPLTWWWCGILVGVAVAAKQTFAVAALGFMLAHTLVVFGSPQAQRVRRLLTDASLFSIGIATPLLVFYLLFWSRGQAGDFLASVFVYPSIYQPPDIQTAGFKRLAWRLGAVATDLGRVPLLLALASAATVMAIRTCIVRARPGLPCEYRIVFVASVALSMLAVNIISPIYFSYHLIPFLVLSATIGGVIIGRLYVVGSGESGAAYHPMVSAGILVLSAVMVLSSWYTNGGKAQALRPLVKGTELVQKGPGFAYVLGMWPQFYAHFGLTPASSVMFPWALDGAPPNWAFRPPGPASPMRRSFQELQQRNTGQLIRDFAATPPKYIVVATFLARATGSTAVTDIMPLDHYIRRHCQYKGELDINLGSDQLLYECRTSVD